jgi:hypothetical protein
MFLTLRKRLSHNLQLDFNYTYSHSIDNSSIIANNNGNFISGATQVLCNAYDLDACKGNSEFDATHQITSDFVYDLPIGRKQFLARNEGTSYNRWHFTLMNAEGDVLMTTHPELHWGKKFKHHFEAVCKFINK